VARGAGAARPALLVATPAHDGGLHHGCVGSLIGTQRLLHARGIPSGHLLLPGCSPIPAARNEVAARYLAEPAWPHLLIVDSDVVWRAGDAPRSLAHDPDPVRGVHARKSPADPRLLFCKRHLKPALRGD
jgi:hypothetical protein